MCKMEGWVTDTLVNIFDVVSGATPATEIKEYWDGDIVWITPNDLSKINHIHIDTSERMISAKGLKSCSANLIPSDSLVMSSRAPIGYLAISTVDYATNQGCKSLIIKDTTKHSIDFHYFNLIFNMKKIKDLGTGTIFMEVSKKDISGVEINFPSSLTEQRKIATILSTIDSSIVQTEQLISKYKNIKQGLMHVLLSYGIDQNGTIRNPHTHTFVEKKGMMVSKDWKVVTLREICKIFGRIGFRGYTLADLVGEGYGAITLSPSNIKEGVLSFNDCTYISFFKYEESPEIKIYDGDILFVKTGSTYGKVAQVKNLPNKATINPQFIVLKEIQCDKVLLTYIMQSFEFQNKVKLIVGGSTIPTLSQEKLYELNIRLPKNPQEQNRIAEILKAQDKLIESEQTNLAKLQKLKQGLMQDLLTGKVRVKI